VFAERGFAWIAGAARANLRVAILMVFDFASVLLAGLVAVCCQYLLVSGLDVNSYLKLWPVAFLTLGINSCFGLYRGGLINSAQELRRYTLSSAGLLCCLVVATLVFDQLPPFTAHLLVGGWLVSLLLVPLCRLAARAVFSRFDWWGQTAIVFGAGKAGRMVVDLLLNRPSLGVRPVAMIDEGPHGEWQWRGVPIVSPVEMTPAVASKFKAQHAIVAMTGTSRKRLITLLQSTLFKFARVTVIPDPFDFSSMWLSAYGIEDRAAPRARPIIVRASAHLAKRSLDIVGVIGLGLLALPFIALIAVAVKLDSSGPLIFGHRRIGQGGREFRAWKFRSMVSNADEVLREHLQNNPDALAEWNAKHKLRDDPRITGVGKFLRKTSLDELPQLWNVFIGEMSLVGPRPIVDAERHHYREQIKLYEGVLPGLSGLWQVSGRSDTSYEERVRLDSYYVRNWSIWLDLCILARTIPALLFGRGAC
jgi:Undecaprenyl-phosphate galactose phosphotransferase WbaP